MPLFLVAVTEPALVAKFQGDASRAEQIVLPLTAILAKDQKAAETKAVVLATELYPTKLNESGNVEQTDTDRWEVHARPF